MNSQKPIFNLEDTDLGMYCIVAIVLIFVIAIVVGADRIPDWAALLSFGSAAIGLVSTIAVAKLRTKQIQGNEPEAGTTIVPAVVKKPPARKKPRRALGTGTGPTTPGGTGD